MFTGLIETIGTVRKVASRSNYLVLNIEPDEPFGEIVRGESIAVSGPCLTVVDFDRNIFTVEASQETTRLTTLKKLRPGSRVNLERALKADARLGGHFVSGHIDDTLKIRRVRRLGDSLEVNADLPEQFAVYVVNKGSVAVDGISLTINEVDEHSFSVNLIPETQKRTTWGHIRVGDEINVEFDLIGKYTLRYQQRQDKSSRLTIDSMRKMGF